MRVFHPTRATPGRTARLGVVLDLRNPPSRIVEVARMCDRAGVASIWVFDHLQNRLDPAGPWHEAWTALTLAAAETRTVRVGHQVLCQSFRSPGLLAKMAATLDTAIGGRLELGIGAGWWEEEYRAFGYAFPSASERVSQVEEYLQILQPALAGEEVAFAGAHYRADRLVCRPPSPQPGGPPLTLGASRPRMLRLAARYADNVNLSSRAAAGDHRALVGRVREACDLVGRDWTTLGITVQVPTSIGRTSAEATARADAEPMFGWIGHPKDYGVFGTLEECQERIRNLADLGVAEVQCVLPNSPDIADVIGQLTAATIG